MVIPLRAGGIPEESGERLLGKLRKEITPRKQEPFVSVLVPVYNGAKYIDQCFENILNQRYNALEIIVVNDGSTDETEECLKRYETIFANRGYRYLHLYQSNARLSVAMNNALQHVTGKYVMIYEIDDVLYRDAILDKVNYLEKHPEIAMVRNNGYYIKKFDGVQYNLFIYRRLEKNEDTVFENILYGHTNNWPASYLIRVSDFFQFWGPTHKIYEHPGGTHLQFMLPMAFGRKVGFLNKPLMDYYAHIDSDSHSGGYEANLRRLQWYEEIRQAVLNYLPMSDNLKTKYQRDLANIYNQHRMIAAVRQRDRVNFIEFAKHQGYSSLRAKCFWIWHSSLLCRLVKYIVKIYTTGKRSLRVFLCNYALWINNSRHYE